jgi:hypothetical protein
MSTQDGVIAFTTIEQGRSSSVRIRQYRALTNRSDWERLWNEHSAGQEPVPAVDFDKEMVLALAIGQRSNGSCSVAIQYVLDLGDKILVMYKEESGGLMSATVMSQPFHFAKAPRSDKPVEFHHLPGMGALNPADMPE